MDQAFLRLDEDQARDHLSHQNRNERDRLVLLYANMHNVNLEISRRSGKIFRPSPDLSIPAPETITADHTGIIGQQHSSGDWADKSHWSGTVGCILVALGILLAVVSFFYNVVADVPADASNYLDVGEIANFDKMAIRSMIMMCSASAFVSGWLLVAASAVVSAIDRASRKCAP